MMSIKTTVISRAILAVFVLFVGSRCFGQREEADVAAASMEKKELEALYSTIQGFVGNWWNGSDLYPDPCGWTPIQGVSCDMINDKFPFNIPKGNWEKLSCSLESLEFRSNPGLVGTIPSSLGVLKNLQSLILLENGLAGEIPPHIGNLIKLRRLVLAGNSLSGHIPDVFHGLTELLILDLSGNSLSGPLPPSVGSLTSLLKLDVSNNHLEGNLLKEIGHLKSLTLMDLRNNKFSGGLSQSFQDMYSLEELVLSNNPIGGSMRILNWENLQNLAVLELSNVGLRGEIPKSLSKLKRLRHLGLSDNNLTGNLSPELARLPCLNALYLDGNNLTGELKFSEEFYGKMGRRFGAWNSPKLCYLVGAMSTSHVPFGVKPCQQRQQGQVV